MRKMPRQTAPLVQPVDTVYVNADGLYDSPLIQRGSRTPRTRRLQESKSGT